MVKSRRPKRSNITIPKWKAQAKLIKPYVSFKVPKKPKRSLKKKIEKLYKEIRHYQSHGYIIYKPKRQKGKRLSKAQNIKLKAAQLIGKNSKDLKVAFVSPAGQKGIKIKFKKGKAYLESKNTQTQFALFNYSDKMELIETHEDEGDLQPILERIIKREIGKTSKRSLFQFLFAGNPSGGLMVREVLGEELASQMIKGTSGSPEGELIINGLARFLKLKK